MLRRGSQLRLLGLILAILVINAGLLPVPASAHRSGCHRWHSCPSDTGSYTCGDLGYSTYCGGGTTNSSANDTSTDTKQPKGNPPPKWESYLGWPFPASVPKDDPAVFLMNFSDRKFAADEDSSVLSLVSAPAKQTVITTTITAREFSGNSSDHTTRLIEEKLSYTSYRRVLGRFVNRTGGVIWYGKAKLFGKGTKGQTTREVTYSYIYPTVLMPGDVGYYDLPIYGLQTDDELAVVIMDWLEGTSTASIHRFPVSNVGWTTVGKYAPYLSVTATVKNDTDKSVSYVDVLVILKDKTGNPIKIEKGFVSIGANQSSTATVSVFSGFDGFDSVEVIAYTD